MFIPRTFGARLLSPFKYITNTGRYFIDRKHGCRASRDKTFLKSFEGKYWLDFSLNKIKNATQARNLLNQILPQAATKENISFIWDKDGTVAAVGGKQISAGGKFLLGVLNGLGIKSSVLTNDHSKQRCISFQRSLTSNFDNHIGFVSDAGKPNIEKLEQEWKQQGSKSNLVIVGDSWADLLAAHKFQNKYPEVKVSIVLVKPHRDKSWAFKFYNIRYVLLERRLLKSFTDKGFSKIPFPTSNMNGLTSIS